MHEYAILSWDDVEHEAGRKVPATTTIALGLDWDWFEIDLTDGHGEELRAALAPWLKVARPVTGPVLASPKPAAPGKRPKSWKVRDWEHGKAWGIAIREFADEHGHGYLTPSGKYYYSKELRDAYAAHIGRE